MAAAAQTKRPESASESLLRGMGARGNCLFPVTPSIMQLRLAGDCLAVLAADWDPETFARDRVRARFK